MLAVFQISQNDFIEHLQVIMSTFTIKSYLFIKNINSHEKIIYFLQMKTEM